MFSHTSVLAALLLWLTGATTKTPPPCGVTFRHKDDGYLFQDEKRLTLLCNGTFTWKHLSCTARDSCFGTWQALGDTVYLTTDPYVLKEIGRQKLFEEPVYTDLSHTTLTYDAPLLIWKRSDTWTDTLFRE